MGCLPLKANEPEIRDLSCAIFDYTRALVIGQVLVSTKGDISKQEL